MRIIVSGGGTGGHVYPALAVLSSLNCGTIGPGTIEQPQAIALPAASVLYVGHESGMEAALVQRAGLEFRGIASGPLRGRRPWETALNVAKIGLGLVQSLALISQFKPDVILATGGYVCVPVVLAGWLRRVPSLVYLPDLVPGMAVKLLSRFANRVAVSFEESRRFLPAGKTVVTGYPVRPELKLVKREEGRESLGLPTDDRVVLILGGSRGASSINSAVARALPELLEMAHVVHISGGDKKVIEALESRSREVAASLRARYHHYPYLHQEMGSALAAADVVVSRAGASVMGEYPAFGLPSVLIPYPFAGAHQEVNARYLVERGAALRLGDEELPKGRLVEVLRELFADPSGLEVMSRNARRLARPNAARAIGDQLLELAGRPAEVKRDVAERD